MDTDDDVQVKKRRTKAQLVREQQIEDLRVLLSLPGNREFLWRLFEECGMFRSLSSLSPEAMQLASGRRDVGLWLRAELNEADPRACINIEREAQDREIQWQKK